MDLRSALAAGAWYLFGAGLALVLLSSYWEGLPLGPRDGQAFLGVAFIGLLLVIIGALVGAGVLATDAGRRWWLVIALGVGGGFMLVALFVARSFLGIMLLPAAILVALATTFSARPLAMSFGVAAAGALLLGAYAVLGGPQVWMTKGLDAATLFAAPAIGVLVFVLAGRLARGLEAGDRLVRG